MSRTWRVGLVFVASLLGMLAIMGWVSLTVLRLDRAQASAQAAAEREEAVRLALWRMDAATVPLIAQESSRPYFVYSSLYPIERAYSRMFNDLAAGDVLVPSPLLAGPPPLVLVHFQLDPAGRMTSPQVHSLFVEGMPTSAPTTLPSSIPVPPEACRQQLADLARIVRRDSLLAGLPVVPAAPPGERVTVGGPVQDISVPNANPAAQQQQDNNFQQGQQWSQIAPRSKGVSQRGSDEFQARNFTMNAYNGGNSLNPSQLALTDNATNVKGQRLPNLGQQQTQARQGPNAAEVLEGPMKPLWAGDALLLARRVSINNKTYVQGCRLDWPAMKAQLLDTVSDLFPAADLAAAPDAGDQPSQPERMMAALPVRLVPGELALKSSPPASPLRLSLAVAWACVLMGAAAVGALLFGTLRLSQRRGDFVSAVTHELRTPLTTFRLYTEMLVDGHIPEAKRSQYLGTLRTESERLSHLVENVLSYAGLEAGSSAVRATAVGVGELLERVSPALRDRAEQVGMTFLAEAGADCAGASVVVDPAAVEHILFNLVDNACKYAASAEDRRIHLEAARRDGGIVLRVRDHGPGVDPKDAARLFQPFSKSARRAAESAPGVGLGLSLSRRLARRFGGELELESTGPAGACFALTLRATTE
ncbi:MAG: HAMP domain-containing sensor histidine kinase [Phycisphaerae bacterium]|nr:HAMP domain-containing sensor histidine kinase [Phycisphaerae bacterium]